MTTVPEIVEPAVGEVIETRGFVPSADTGVDPSVGYSGLRLSVISDVGRFHFTSPQFWNPNTRLVRQRTATMN
jgi:hypothetical protein